MKKRQILQWAMTLLVCSVEKTFSAPIPELQKIIQSEIISVDNEVTQCSVDDGPAHLYKSGDKSVANSVANSVASSGASSEAGLLDKMIYRNFFVRIQTRVGFSIPSILEVYIVPEVDMLWQRPVPDGWETYYPNKHAVPLK